MKELGKKFNIFSLKKQIQMGIRLRVICNRVGGKGQELTALNLKGLYTDRMFIGLSELLEGHVRLIGNGVEVSVSRALNTKKIY